jgi:hypothetical protein
MNIEDTFFRLDNKSEFDNAKSKLYLNPKLINEISGGKYNNYGKDLVGLLIGGNYPSESFYKINHIFVSEDLGPSEMSELKSKPFLKKLICDYWNSKEKSDYSFGLFDEPLGLFYYCDNSLKLKNKYELLKLNNYMVRNELACDLTMILNNNNDFKIYPLNEYELFSK